MLDTNIVSSAVRDTSGYAARRIDGVGRETLATSIIVAGELEFGARRIGNAQLTARIERALRMIEILPVKSPVSAVYGEIRAALERSGKLIGHNDLWIAAHALALDLTLVTDNTREFERVEGLRVENWLRA